MFLRKSAKTSPTLPKFLAARTFLIKQAILLAYRSNNPVRKYSTKSGFCTARGATGSAKCARESILPPHLLRFCYKTVTSARYFIYTFAKSKAVRHCRTAARGRRKVAQGTRQAGQDPRQAMQGRRKAAQGARQAGQDPRQAMQGRRKVAQGTRQAGQDPRQAMQGRRKAAQGTRQAGQDPRQAMQGKRKAAQGADTASHATLQMVCPE